MKRLIANFLPPPAVLSVYVVLLILMQGWTFFLNQWDPFFYHSVTVITPQVKVGRTFVEELDVQRYRICKVDIDRFMVEEATHNVIMRERVPGGATRIGRSKARNMVEVPANANPGWVTLLQNTNSDCIDGMHSMQWPVIRFEIVP